MLTSCIYFWLDVKVYECNLAWYEGNNSNILQLNHIVVNVLFLTININVCLIKFIEYYFNPCAWKVQGHNTCTNMLKSHNTYRIYQSYCYLLLSVATKEKHPNRQRHVSGVLVFSHMSWDVTCTWLVIKSTSNQQAVSPIRLSYFIANFVAVINRMRFYPISTNNLSVR